MFKKIINQAPIVVMYAMIAFLPLIFSFILPINNVFELSKSSFFYFLLSLLLSLTLIKIIYFGFPIIKFKDLNRQKALITLIIAFFVFVLYLLFNSLFIAENIELSIFGSYQRQQGLLFYVSSFLFFLLVLYNLLISKLKSLDTIFTVVALSGFLVSVIGIWQYLGLDHYVWQESLLAERIISTLGQPNNLGAFLLFSLASSLIILKDNKKKYLVIIIFYFQLLAMYLSGSKSAWLGLLFALAVYQFLKIKERISLKKIVIGFLSLTIIGTFLFSDRFENSFNSGSSVLRLEFYKTSMSSWLDKPLFAYGLEHGSKALIKGYSPEWALFLQVNDYPDRAHNLVLQTLITYGLFGFLLLFLIYWYLFKYFVLFKNKFKNKQLIIILGLLAYFIFLLFNFASIVSHLYFWLFLAFLFYYSLAGEIVIKKINIRKILIYPISLILLLLVIFCYNFSSSKLLTDRLFYQCKQSNNLDICFQAIEKTKSIASKKYYSSYTYSSLVDNYASYPEELQAIVLKDINKYYNSLKTNDYHLQFKLACFLDKAEKTNLFEKLEKESPSRPLIYQTRADCYLRKGEFNLAKENYTKALKLLPTTYKGEGSNRFKSYLKFYKHWLYYGLAQSHFALEEYDLAVDNYRLSFYNHPYSQTTWLNLVKTLYLNNQVDLANQEILWAQKYWPNDSFWSQDNFK